MAEREEQRQAQLLQERIARSLAGAGPSDAHAAQAEDQVKRTLKVGTSSARPLGAVMAVWVEWEPNGAERILLAVEHNKILV